ncbi:MAG TPA: hypothetical protein VEH30_16510 [Terriglobales bacterium]|nr:hypothetical protein [Terriglobales bacterium]
MSMDENATVGRVVLEDRQVFIGAKRESCQRNQKIPGRVKWPAIVQQQMILKVIRLHGLLRGELRSGRNVPAGIMRPADFVLDYIVLVRDMPFPHVDYL